MLTKNDLSQIKNIIEEAIETKTKKIVDEAIESKTRKIVNESFEDFYDHMFEPHVTQSAQQHKEIVEEINGLKKEIKGLKNETEEIKDFIKDHDKRIDTLEVFTGVR